MVQTPVLGNIGFPRDIPCKTPMLAPMAPMVRWARKGGRVPKIVAADIAGYRELHLVQKIEGGTMGHPGQSAGVRMGISLK